MLLFFITNFLFVFSSLGYLYFFNMFRWDAHLVVTYSANCRGVPLPFLLWCACVALYYHYICFRNYFHLILPTAKWRFLVNLLYFIIHGNGIFFLIENNKMCDGLYAWLDFLAGFTLFTFDRIFLYIHIFTCVCYFMILYVFHIHIPRRQLYCYDLWLCTVFDEKLIWISTFPFSITNLTW